MTTLFYKGIEFDDWCRDEYGIWSNICRDHAEQYADILGNIDDSDFCQVEICGVKGCPIGYKDSNREATAYYEFDVAHVVLKTLVQ